MTITIINQLEAALGETVQLLSSFTEEAINKIPFEGSWTAAQVARHLYKSEEGMDRLLLTATQTVTRQPDENAAELERILLDMENKMVSPGFLVPEDEVYNKTELIKGLLNVKDIMLKAIEAANLRELAPLPDGHPLKGNTKLEIVHFIAYHTKRHNRQIKDIAVKLNQ